MAVSSTHTASNPAYTELPGWVRACYEDKSLDALPEGIRSAIGGELDLARANINHARFHPRYVIFFIDDVEPENGIIFRRFELTIPLKVRGFPRSRVRLRVTEERIHFIHADWHGEHDGWDIIPTGPTPPYYREGKLVQVEGRKLRSPDASPWDGSEGFEPGSDDDLQGWRPGPSSMDRSHH